MKHTEDGGGFPAAHPTATAGFLSQPAPPLLSPANESPQVHMTTTSAVVPTAGPSPSKRGGSRKLSLDSSTHSAGKSSRRTSEDQGCVNVDAEVPRGEHSGWHPYKESVFGETANL